MKPKSNAPPVRTNGFQDENATNANAIHPFPAVIPLFQKFVFARETQAPLTATVPRAGTDPERPDLSGRSVFPWNPV